MRNLSTASVTDPSPTSSTPGIARDTDTNAADFVFVDTNGTSAGGGQRLGSPGPQNLSSPVPNGRLTIGLLDPCSPASAAPNAVVVSTSDPANNSTFGTVELRRTITNTTGASVTRLRVRVTDQRTFPAPSGIADLRSRTSTDAVVTVDRAPCGTGTSNVTVRGTTLEQPPSQPNGGGFNATLSLGTVTLATPLLPGASIDARFLFGVQQTGAVSAQIVVEALTNGTVTPPTLTCLGANQPTNGCAAPTVTNDAYSTTRGQALNVVAPGVLANDGAGATVIPSSVTQPAHGSVVVNANGSFTYTPDPAHTGPDTFLYRATNGADDSLTAQVTIDVSAGPPAGSTRFVPLTPARFLDTRNPTDITGGAPIPAGGSIDLQITGRLGVPATGVSAVVLNVTATETAAPGFVTLWPTGETKPVVSNLNATASQQDIANLATVRIGTDGRVSLFSQSGTHLVVDIAGYYEPTAVAVSAGRYQPLSPDRLLDTRLALGIGSTTSIPPGGTVELQVTGRGGVPSTGVSAVVLSVVAAEASGGGFVTVWPTGLTRPTASSLNVMRAGQNVPNAVIVPVGAGGKVSLFTQRGSHFVVDVNGWFTDATASPGVAGLFRPQSPVRILDTRIPVGTPTASPVGAGDSIGLQITGANGVPTSGVVAAVLNLTGTEALGPGFVTQWPAGATRPVVSALNIGAAGDTVGAMATATIGSGGQVSLFSQGGAHLIADLAGFYTADP